jgi:hypothetical protein
MTPPAEILAFRPKAAQRVETVAYRRRGQLLGLLSVLRGERSRERSTGPIQRSPAARPFSGARLSEENVGFTRAALVHATRRRGR